MRCPKMQAAILLKTTTPSLLKLYVPAYVLTCRIQETQQLFSKVASHYMLPRLTFLVIWARMV